MENNELNKRVNEYQTLFIKESDETARYGKTVYVRTEFHNRISKIVHTVGGNEVSIFSYIDNVLDNHFKSFRDEISESYNRKKITDLF